MNVPKEYLGDSVYAEYIEEPNGCVEFLVLTTNNGDEDTNKIYIDSNVFAALMKYVDKIKEANKNG